ncbi:hypothetical protein [Photobacterium sp. R1]
MLVTPPPCLQRIFTMVMVSAAKHTSADRTKGSEYGGILLGDTTQSGASAIVVAPASLFDIQLCQYF